MRRPLSGAIRRSGERMFSAIDVTLLTNQEATRSAILDAFDRLAARSSRRTRSCSMSRHMACAARATNVSCWSRRMSADPASLPEFSRSAIDETTLIGALSRIRARDALLFLDTCYSGAVTADALANVGHETGRYLLAASSSVQEALDSYDSRNGVFVYAVREGLQGRAPHGSDDVVSALALGEYVSGRVGVLARQKGHDQDAVFKTAQQELRSFPIGTVVGVGQ